MKRLFLVWYFLALYLPYCTVFAQNTQPKLQLANRYHEQINLSDYWVSEKYDGIRGYWDGRQMMSRRGNMIHTPDWFVDTLPNIELDGELWLARGQFDRLSSTIRRHRIDAVGWRNIQYLIFDLPASEHPFNVRLEQIKQIVKQVNRPHIRAVEQFKVIDHQQLLETLDTIVKNEGEGLMLHRGAALYRHNRSDDLLKFKRYDDAEAVVIEHIGGKGKYKGLLGSIRVETSDGLQFKIGTGFSDEERANPPLIGSIITYRYLGLTNKGTPRFASFVRVRPTH